MQFLAQALANKLTAAIASEGNIPVDLEVTVTDVDGKTVKLVGKANSLQVQIVSGNTPRLVISTNDTVEA